MEEGFIQWQLAKESVSTPLYDGECDGMRAGNFKLIKASLMSGMIGSINMTTSPCCNNVIA